MREEQPCTVTCKIKLDAEAAKDFKEKIDDEYSVNMIVDNLPVAVCKRSLDRSPSTIYEQGFLVGFKGNYAGVNVFSCFFLKICVILQLTNACFCRAMCINILSIIT